MAKLAIGVDLGGTDIKAGVVDDAGRILSRIKRPTEPERGRRAVIENIAEAAEAARTEADVPWRRIAGVGLGSPGVFEMPRGLVRNSPNIRCLEGHELRQPVQRALNRKGLTVTLDNDANVAAYAETWIGAGKEKQTLALFTLGTGIGGGLVLNGEVWRGAWGAAAELGHQIVRPDEPARASGTPGALEDVASATALVGSLKEAVKARKRTRLAKRVRAGEKITARDIFDAAKAGDALCLKLVNEAGKFLGIGVTNMLHILNVELAVFAGGMTAAGSILLKPIREEVRKRAFPLSRRHVKILFSKLGNDAGLIGAAGLALHTRAGRRGTR